MKPTDLAYYLSKFFQSYLPGIQGASPKTVISYETTFCLFFKYCTEQKNIKVNRFKIEHITPDLVTAFLQHLEDSGNSISTRNQRHSAIRSFFKYIQITEPKYIFQAQQMLGIRLKRQKKPIINHLSLEALKLILEQPETNLKLQYRDLMLLTILYDTAARVDELINIRFKDIRLEYPCTITLNGKGRKSRIVPVSQTTMKLIQMYVEKEHSGLLSDQYLFVNRSQNKLSSAGVSYILNKYVELARNKNPGIIPETITPHCLRHSKAMHLLQNGVNLVYIRDFLGHESIKSTEIYAKSDSETKRKAIEKTYPALSTSSPEQTWSDNPKLFDWLKSMSK